MCALYLGINGIHDRVLQELHHDEPLQLLKVLLVGLVHGLQMHDKMRAHSHFVLFRQNVLLFHSTMSWPRTDPLLVDVGQEEAVLLVQVIAQGVVPVLRLHQADGHKRNVQQSRR